MYQVYHNNATTNIPNRSQIRNNSEFTIQQAERFKVSVHT